VVELDTRRVVATNRSMIRTKQRLGHVINSLAASNQCLARDIQRLIAMITGRSCETYNAWLEGREAWPRGMSVCVG
jgi:hypothetical protein